MGFFLKRLFSLDPLKGGPSAREKNAREAMEKKTQNCGGSCLFQVRRSVVERSPWELRHLTFGAPKFGRFFGFGKSPNIFQRKISGFQVQNGDQTWSRHLTIWKGSLNHPKNSFFVFIRSIHKPEVLLIFVIFYGYSTYHPETKALLNLYSLGVG